MSGETDESTPRDGAVSAAAEPGTAARADTPPGRARPKRRNPAGIDTVTTPAPPRPSTLPRTASAKPALTPWQRAAAARPDGMDSETPVASAPSGPGPTPPSESSPPVGIVRWRDTGGDSATPAWSFLPPEAASEPDTGTLAPGGTPPDATGGLFGLAGGAGPAPATATPDTAATPAIAVPDPAPGTTPLDGTSPIEEIPAGIATSEIAPATPEIAGGPITLPAIPSIGSGNLPLITPLGGLPAATPVVPDNAGVGTLSSAPGSWVRAGPTEGIPALINLANQYGSGPAATINTGSGSYVTGSYGAGNAADDYTPVQLNQQAQAAAMTNLDGELKNLLDSLAGNIKSDQAQINQLITIVNNGLERLGNYADTPGGQLAVDQLIITALDQALTIFGNGIANVAQTRNEVDQLTGQYVTNLTAPSGSGGSGYGEPVAVSGTVQQWIQEAIQILEQMGYSPGDIDPNAIAIIIQNESGGNPDAVNNWDSNAAAGTPSTGLMQTIGPTFEEYAAPGHDNIYNPVDNIIAGTRYAISRYGSTDNVPGVVAVRSGGSYVGY